MLSGERSFFIECSGEGDLFFNPFGALIEKDINGSFTVDTGHMVAWEPSLTYSIRGLGGLKSTLLSGEGVADSSRLQEFPHVSLIQMRSIPLCGQHPDEISASHRL